MQTLFTITSAATCEKRTSKTTSSAVCDNEYAKAYGELVRGGCCLHFMLCFVYSNNPRLFADNRVNYFCEILVQKKHSKIHSSSLSAKRIVSLAERAYLMCSLVRKLRYLIEPVCLNVHSHIFEVMSVPRIN